MTTCTPPNVVATLPLESSANVAGVLGPIGLELGPKMEMISPGATGPLEPVAALMIAEMVGSGAVTTRVTLITLFPTAPLPPATAIVPL